MQAFEHILYFADGNFGPTQALRRAVALAQRYQARLTLMDVTIESGFTADLVKRFGLGDDVQQSEQRLAALTHLAEGWVRGQTPRLRVTIGTPFIEVIRAVQRDGHDLVLKPVRPRPGNRGLFVSNDMHLLRKCPCPVWIEREPDQPDGEAVPAAADAEIPLPSCGRVLAAVDAAQPGSDAINRRILDTAAMVAADSGGALDIVHVWQAPFDPVGPAVSQAQEPDPRLSEALGAIEHQHATALEELGSSYRPRLGGGNHLLRGEPAAEVLGCARSLTSDLLVMATLSRPREPGLFIGTTAEDLLQGAQTSVLALKPAGFVSPVQ
jgi:nucleotide-binding universal stress UspA family protein